MPGMFGEIAKGVKGFYKTERHDDFVKEYKQYRNSLRGNDPINKNPANGDVSDPSILDNLRAYGAVIKMGAQRHMMNPKVMERLGYTGNTPVNANELFANFKKTDYVKGAFLNENGTINKTAAGVAGVGVLGTGYAAISNDQENYRKYGGIPRI